MFSHFVAHHHFIVEYISFPGRLIKTFARHSHTWNAIAREVYVFAMRGLRAKYKFDWTVLVLCITHRRTFEILKDKLRARGDGKIDQNVIRS